MSMQKALEVGHVVQQRLNKKQVGPARPRVLADEIVVQLGDEPWWYVPVSVHRDTEHMYLVYQAFSEVEEELESDNLNVLLVPRIIPFQRLQDSA